MLGALEAAREAVDGFFAGPDCTALGLTPTASLLGPLPVLTVISAGCYELAVHALDLVSSGAHRRRSGCSWPGWGRSST